MLTRALNSLLFVLLALALFGCSSIPSVFDRTQSAQRLAQEAGWSWGSIESARFLLAYARPRADQIVSSDVRLKSLLSGPPILLTVYLEGDGLAWLSASRPSLNPTPMNPLALKLALKDSTGVVAYLGRPCQYTTQSACSQRDWTSARFAPEVIEATQLALNQLVQDLVKEWVVLRSVSGSNPEIKIQLHLVGYSGGAAVALLAAAGRTDVVRVTTVAGNLDHAEWTQRLRLTPLTHSLNPADFGTKLRTIPQIHWVGGKDNVVPPWVAQSYQHKTGMSGSVRVISDFGHDCCWVEQWPLR